MLYIFKEMHKYLKAKKIPYNPYILISYTP